MLIAILCTEGQMDQTEVHKECKAGKWAPIFVWREGDKTIVPLFHDAKNSKSFIRRNLPADWPKGGVVLTEDDVKNMRDNGWEVREMTFPNIIKDLPGITFGMEILEFDALDVFSVRG
jgi:hypothetical protein